MIRCIKYNNSVNSKVRVSIATAIITVTLLSVTLAYFSTSSSLSLLYYKPFFYAFAQTQGGNPALSLSNLIKQGQPHQGTSAPVTVIDFSDLQCPLCDRFVKAT